MKIRVYENHLSLDIISDISGWWLLLVAFQTLIHG